MKKASAHLIIREATAADIEALARLHVEAWRAAYQHIFPEMDHFPTFKTREHQWKEAFKVTDGSWFCYVIEDKGQLVGFAKGARADHPEFEGELSKIYLLQPYKGRGLGSLLIAQVACRFLSKGITSMILFAEPLNPSCRFFEALGGEKLLDKNGKFHGGYGWRDLHVLAAFSTVEH